MLNLWQVLVVTDLQPRANLRANRGTGPFRGQKPLYLRAQVLLSSGYVMVSI